MPQFKTQSDRFIADACTVMRKSAQHALMLGDLRDMLTAHNVNCCDGEDTYFDEDFTEYRSDIAVIDEVEFFQRYVLE